jgi:hypothetical protein
VAVGTKALSEKGGAIRSLLKAIAAGTNLISRDKVKALASETKWTRTDPAVGAKSIANVTYISRPDETWLRGVDTWLDLMRSSHSFQKVLKDKDPREIRSLVFDLKPLDEALKEMARK